MAWRNTDDIVYHGFIIWTKDFPSLEATGPKRETAINVLCERSRSRLEG